MKLIGLLISILIFSILQGQQQFVGKYKLVVGDTTNNANVETEFVKMFDIKSDFSYSYVEGQNPTIFKHAQRTSVSGSWKSSTDTIIFYNKDFVPPAGATLKSFENQNFTGIRIKILDKNGNPLTIRNCRIDSVSGEYPIIYSYLPYKLVSLNIIDIKSSACSKVYFTPTTFCPDYETGFYDIDVKGIKSGTLIEFTLNSTLIEQTFHNKKYYLYRGVLLEKSTSHLIPDAWTDKFIKLK